MNTGDGVVALGPGVGNGARATSIGYSEIQTGTTISSTGNPPTQDGIESFKTVTGGGGGGGGGGGAGSAAANAAATAPKRPVRRGGKPPPDRPVRALFCLPLKNPVRKMCIEIVEWKYPFYSDN